MAILKVLTSLLLGLAFLQLCRGQSRIIGGTPVLTNRFPYFARLRIVFTENSQQYVTYCGGALVTSEIVLVGCMGCKMNCCMIPELMICLFLSSGQTVAHCLVDSKIVSISVVLGRYGNTPTTTSQKIKATSWTPHPMYDSTLKTDDIGVVKLSQKVAITPIKLSFTSGFPKQGRNVTVVGDDSKSLSQVQLLVRNWDDCYKLYGEVDGTGKICAGGNGKVSKKLSLSYMYRLQFVLMRAILRMLVQVILEAPWLSGDKLVLGMFLQGLYHTALTPAITCQSYIHASAHTRIGSGRKPVLEATFHHGAVEANSKLSMESPYLGMVHSTNHWLASFHDYISLNDP